MQNKLIIIMVESIFSFFAVFYSYQFDVLLAYLGKCVSYPPQVLDSKLL